MDCVSKAKDGNRMQSETAKSVLDITVLMGGPSSEREVSLLSGQAIADALERRGHKVCRADISPTETAALDRPEIDVVFIALHGEFGESGQVQELCENAGLRYTGSGPRASELALDKAATKQAAKRVNVPTPDWMIIEEYHEPAQVAEWLLQLDLPVVLKPIDGGSSVDIVIARTNEQRDQALEALLDKYSRVMLERYVRGRELTVGILGDQAFEVLEVLPDGDFYDYRAKYADDAGTTYTFDHGLDGETIEKLQQSALETHRVLGCRDMSRVDFLLDEDGVGWMLEINTIPGFTSHSLLPKAAERAGVGFDELCDRIARMAMARTA